MRCLAPVLLAALLLACGKDKRASPAPSADPGPPKPPSPSALPVCGSSDPLAALCNLGTDTARFECDQPEPVQFCSRGVEWHCSSPKSDPPAVMYRARHDQPSRPVKPGELVDVSGWRREGKVRGVAVTMRVADGKEAAARRDEIGEKLKAWGCFAQWDPRRKDYDYKCFSGRQVWEARLRATSRQVTLEAAEPGWLDCTP